MQHIIIPYSKQTNQKNIKAWIMPATQTWLIIILCILGSDQTQ